MDNGEQMIKQNRCWSLWAKVWGDTGFASSQKTKLLKVTYKVQRDTKELDSGET